MGTLGEVSMGLFGSRRRQCDINEPCLVLSDSVPRFGDSERGRRGLLQRDRRRAGAVQRR